jgi:NitT/TauT family transport system permease protein
MAADVTVAGGHGDLEALDALEMVQAQEVPRGRRVWTKTWPKLLAVATVLLAWQLLVASHHWPPYVLPGPRATFDQLFADAGTVAFWQAVGITMRRAVIGFAISVVLGTVLGAGVSRIPVLRSALGSAITGLQTMPSIAWLPIALLLFQLSEGAILFIIVIGAAPSIANGLINGVDNTALLHVRVGRTLGASGVSLFRHVYLPSAMPTFVGGLRQGWAFAWRALIAAELYVPVGHIFSLGVRLDNAEQTSDSVEMLAMIVTIFIVGIVVNTAFVALDRGVRRRRGLLTTEC